MFTQNYINMQFNRFFGLSSGATNGLSTQPLRTIEGKTLNSFINDHFSDIGESLHYVKFTVSTSSGGIMFGSGTTPASLSDYKLESMITSGLSTVSYSRSLGREEDGRFCVYGQYALKNTSDIAISISEIGAVQIYLTGSSSSERDLCLLERTVLDEPVVINPNEIKLITYKFIFNQGMYA